MTVIPHDLMDRRDGPLYSSGDTIQQGQSIRTSSSAPEHRTPPAHQCRVSSSFEQFWHATDFCRGQTSQEMGCLVRKWHTRVAMASCAPRNRGKPSMTFESPFIHVVEHGQIEIANEDIRSDPSACFSADSCCHVLQWEPTTTQHPRNWTRRPMVAKAIKFGKSEQ